MSKGKSPDTLQQSRRLAGFKSFSQTDLSEWPRRPTKIRYQDDRPRHESAVLALGLAAVSDVSGPAILSIGRNVRVLNAANQAMSATGISQVFMSDDFLAGQPQIDRVLYRSSSSHTVGSVVYPSLNWVPMPTALVASQNSIIAGEFQAPAAAPVSGASGSALQVGSPSFAIDGTRVRARLTYIPTGVYALFIGGQASYVVLESITALPISGSAASGIRLSSQAQNVNISSLHFEKITGTLITVDGSATYFTNTGDIWGPSGVAFPLVPSPAFRAMA